MQKLNRIRIHGNVTHHIRQSVMNKTLLKRIKIKFFTLTETSLSKG